MVISSLVIKCVSGKEEQLAKAAANIPGLELVTIVDGQIIFTLESRSFKEAHQTLEDELKELPGALGVYPIYIQEDEDAAL